MKVRLKIAEVHCLSGDCEWGMTANVGDKRQVAGFPGLIAKIKSIEHGEQLIRAHAWLHYTEKHRTDEPRRKYQ